MTNRRVGLTAFGTYNGVDFNKAFVELTQLALAS